MNNPSRAWFFSSKELGVIEQCITDLLSNSSLSKRQRKSVFKRACRLLHDSRLIPPEFTIKALGAGCDSVGEPGIVVYTGIALNTIIAQLPGEKSNVDN